MPRAIELDLSLDANVDTTPFPKAYAPFQLASLVDPKSIQKLTDLGGVDGVLKALGTDPEDGLRFGPIPGRHSDTHEGLVKSDTFETLDIEKGKERQPTTVHQAESNDDDDPDRRNPYNATLEDRQRVYGKNIVPAKKSKSLLMLMWIGLQDKVLVS